MKVSARRYVCFTFGWAIIMLVAAGLVKIYWEQIMGFIFYALLTVVAAITPGDHYWPC